MGDDARREAEDRLAQVRDVYDRHGATFHVAWVGAAVVVLLAGIVMVVLPGPAAVVIPLGVAMLAVVFGWARKLLLFGADEGADAVHAWRDASTAARVTTVLVLVAGVGTLAAWVLL